MLISFPRKKQERWHEAKSKPRPRGGKSAERRAWHTSVLLKEVAGKWWIAVDVRPASRVLEGGCLRRAERLHGRGGQTIGTPERHKQRSGGDRERPYLLFACLREEAEEGCGCGYGTKTPPRLRWPGLRGGTARSQEVLDRCVLCGALRRPRRPRPPRRTGGRGDQGTVDRQLGTSVEWKAVGDHSIRRLSVLVRLGMLRSKRSV